MSQDLFAFSLFLTDASSWESLTTPSLSLSESLWRITVKSPATFSERIPKVLQSYINPTASEL